LPAYRPPLAAREGLRLDFNENTVGCSPRVLERLRSITGEELARYPERAPVESIVAQYLEVDPREVLLTNGIDEAIHLLCETYLEPGDEVLIPVPTFAMYEVFAAATGARVVKLPAAKDFTFPARELRERLSDRTRLIVIANPNNPTGAVLPPQILIDLAQRSPHAALLVDEAYFEFFGETMLRQWATLPNLFVARTFSKAYGLAGLRIGVLMGSAGVMNDVRRVASPYSVNSVALACLPAALADHDYVRDYAMQIRASRESFQQQLCEWGLRFWPSQANFVLISIGPRHAEFVQAMRTKGILVRDRSSDPGCEGCVRITLGSEEQTDLLIRTLASVLADLRLLPQEILR
jgi:histidinol-phosphate aminotransferase